jgi:uncharacterized protein (DUF488 family)
MIKGWRAGYHGAMTRIATIGYEGRAQHDVLKLLVDAGVQTLIDVRIRAQSRKPGFSKSTLAAGLGEVGIGYEHLRALGTPIDIRDRFRSGAVEEGRERYREYLTGDPEAAAELERLTSMVEAKPDGGIAILCFEHDPRHCHRMVICEELAAARGIEADHLGAPSVA